MPVPDPHFDEPTVELDSNLWQAYRRAIDNAEGWKKEADRIRKEIEARLGDATAGLVDGRKVVYYRPADKWAEARILKDYPDLAGHYMRTKEQPWFDMDSFALHHPDIAEKYQVRSFRRAE